MDGDEKARVPPTSSLAPRLCRPLGHRAGAAWPAGAPRGRAAPRSGRTRRASWMGERWSVEFPFSRSARHSNSWLTSRSISQPAETSTTSSSDLSLYRAFQKRQIRQDKQRNENQKIESDGILLLHLLLARPERTRKLKGLVEVDGEALEQRPIHADIRWSALFI